MQNTVTPNATSDDSRAILSELSQDFDLEEEFSEDELDAMQENAERETWEEIDAMYHEYQEPYIPYDGDIH
jgi:hypothetical protein